MLVEVSVGFERAAGLGGEGAYEFEGPELG